MEEAKSTFAPVAEHSREATKSQSTNTDGIVLPNHMKRLSLSTAAATPLPPSSPAGPPRAKQENLHNATPAALDHGARPPIRRAPSSSSLGSNDRSQTPALHKRASLNSLHVAGGATPPRSPAPRRTSSYYSSSPNMGARLNLQPPVEEPSRPPVTPVSVAHDYFAKELVLHQNDGENSENAETVVILQDDCYGHRYSRPRTSRANLGTIVERPERIHASVIGLATAYVRLGGRHAGGHTAPHPKKHPSASSPTPFKIHKTTRRMSLKSPAATAIHGAKWMNELSAMCDSAESKLALSGKELTRPVPAEQTNGNSYAERSKLHEGDLYLCAGSLDALEGALGGVCDGVDAVFNAGVAKRAFVCIRPPGHHCSADMPSGFCWLNNVHVGIGHAMLTHGLTHAAIIDFDLHHGDGSQSITWAHNTRIAGLPRNTPISKKTAIGYFSLHDINSYPCEMGDDEKVRNASLCIENAHGQTVWNVHLQPWKTDADFWALYEERYLVVLEKARAFLRLHSDRLRQAPTHPKPRAAIFLSAGFDASEWESPGMQRHQVNVPTEFYARFTRDVVTLSEEEGLGVEGRVISVLEGGYSDRALMSGVLSHLSGLSTSVSSSRPSSLSNGLGQEMGHELDKLATIGKFPRSSVDSRKGNIEAFDPAWWSLPHLEEIESLLSPRMPAAAPKRQRNETRPTYTSATQSYTAKIVSPPQGRRSIPGHGPSFAQASSSPSRAPTPPPPAVDWALAAHELSKLLVPSDRETRSCRAEDLNAEASRARRDRYSSIELPVDIPPTDAKQMQLREKRNKPTRYVTEETEEKPVTRANRRKTIADVTLLAQDDELLAAVSRNTEVEQNRRPSRRRSSAASSISSLHADQTLEYSLSSVVEDQSQQEPLVVKKSRVPANPGADLAKPKAIKKQPAVPRIPLNQTSTLRSLAAATSSHETGKAPLSVNDDLKNKDVDHLASGIKRMSIKLNVPPKQEQNAREAKAVSAPRGRPARTAAAKAAKPKSPIKSKASARVDLPPVEYPMNGGASLEPPILSAAVTDDLPVQALFLSEQAQQIPSQEGPKPMPPPSLAPIVPALPAYNFETGPTEFPQPGTETNKNADLGLKEMSLEPLTSSPPAPPVPSTPITAKRTRQDLPVFTSTSPISFGRPNEFSNNSDQTMVPSTKSKVEDADSLAPPPFTIQPTIENSMRLNERVALGPPLISQPPAGSGINKDKPVLSIWDIPDTPQGRKP